MIYQNKDNLKQSFIVNEKDINKRLDIFLTLHLSKFSRSYIKTQINEENVLINGQVEFHPQYRVKLNDKVEVEFEIPKKDQENIIIAKKMHLDVVYEDESILAINKKEGIVVHPAIGHWHHTLVNGVKYYLQSKGQDVLGDKRAGLVHRLDKATSGIILIAKTPESLWKLSKQFAMREVEKEYLVLVSGFVKQGFEVKNEIGRHKLKRKKFSSFTRKGKQSHTIFQKIIASLDKKYSLLSAFPKTGRTHQIRVHLKESNFPIIGDRKYKGEKASRLMLHAYKISFQHPISQKIIKISAKPDKKFIKELKKHKINFKY